MQLASAIRFVDFAMGPRDSGSLRLTPVIALAYHTGGLPVHLPYLQRDALPEVASFRARGRLAGVPLVFRLAGVHPSHRTMCSGKDSYDSDDEKTSTKEDSDHGVSVCVSLSRPSRRSRRYTAGSGDGSGSRALLGLLSSHPGLRAWT